jgi:DNA polymerase III alpha subunit (gram-positive type)
MSETQDIQDIYTPFRARLNELRMAHQGSAFDYDTVAGNKAARSYVHSLRGEKGSIEAARKDAKAEVLAKGKAIDAGAAALIGEIDEMIEVHVKRLRAIEEREAARIKAHTDWIEHLNSLYVALRANWQTMDRVQFDVALEEVDRAQRCDFQEYTEAAGEAINRLIEGVKELLPKRDQYDCDQAELAELRRAKAEGEARARREQEDRERAERDARIAAAAAEKAEREARERAEDEQRQRDREAQQAIQRAENEARMAEQRLEDERRENARREQERTAAIQVEENARRARESDERHRAAVRDGIVDALIATAGLSRPKAAAVLHAITVIGVPHVRIEY